MAKVLGLGYGDIAGQLGRSESAVRGLAARALACSSEALQTLPRPTEASTCIRSK